MIDVVMGQEHFFDRGEGDFQRREILRAPEPQSNRNLSSPASTNIDAQACLVEKRSSRAEKRDADFIFGKRFARIVFRRP